MDRWTDNSSDHRYRSGKMHKKHLHVCKFDVLEVIFSKINSQTVRKHVSGLRNLA